SGPTRAARDVARTARRECARGPPHPAVPARRRPPTSPAPAGTAPDPTQRMMLGGKVAQLRAGAFHRVQDVSRAELLIRSGPRLLQSRLLKRQFHLVLDGVGVERMLAQLLKVLHPSAQPLAIIGVERKVLRRRVQLAVAIEMGELGIIYVRRVEDDSFEE